MSFPTDETIEHNKTYECFLVLEKWLQGNYNSEDKIPNNCIACDLQLISY